MCGLYMLNNYYGPIHFWHSPLCYVYKSTLPHNYRPWRKMVDEGGVASLDGERRMDIIYEEEGDRRQTQ